MAYIMDFFGAPNLEKVAAAIQAEKVKHPAYVFIRSEDGSDTGRLAFVDKGNELKFIIGDEAKTQVMRVDELPAIEAGSTEILYICGDVVYSFNGEEYVPAYKDHSVELEELSTRISAIEETIPTFEEKDIALEEKTAALEEAMAKLDKNSNSFIKKKYEITDVPVGTLVDYRDNEIRIMCPANTVWTKQNVGATGDANTYYATFKTYVPSDDVVGYIEHLGDQVDEEILNTFSVDENGNRYQPTWFGLAKCDESDQWTYYGANSSKEKYMGWNYQIDWYNADGVIIASDSIRINLSNEDCYSVIEPYYVSKVTDMSAEIEALTNKLAVLEENVAVLEESTTTFVELE